MTRTVARTFSPEFTYSADLLLPTVLPAGVGGKKQLSLAEQLQDSAIVFEVWLVFRFISLLPEKRFPEKCHFRPWLFKNLDSAFHEINLHPGVKYMYLGNQVRYPLYSALLLLNNKSQHFLLINGKQIEEELGYNFH